MFLYWTVVLEVFMTDFHSLKASFNEPESDHLFEAAVSVPAGLDDYLDNCLSNPYTDCNCNDDKQCEEALASRQGSIKKQARQFRTTQPLTFGSGIFMGE